jgi:hypothetical protein
MDGASCDEARIVVLSEGSKVVMVDVYSDCVSRVLDVRGGARRGEAMVIRWLLCKQSIPRQSGGQERWWGAHVPTCLPNSNFFAIPLSPSRSNHHAFV